MLCAVYVGGRRRHILPGAGGGGPVPLRGDEPRDLAAIEVMICKLLMVRGNRNWATGCLASPQAPNGLVTLEKLITVIAVSQVHHLAPHARPARAVPAPEVHPPDPPQRRAALLQGDGPQPVLGAYTTQRLGRVGVCLSLHGGGAGDLTACLFTMKGPGTQHLHGRVTAIRLGGGLCCRLGPRRRLQRPRQGIVLPPGRIGPLFSGPFHAL